MTYPGGKGASGVVQKIINQQPPHCCYIEPFLGGGAVMRAKRPADFQIGIDRDPSCIANFGAAAGNPLVFVDNGLKWLKQREKCHNLRPDTLIYCDPPYPLGTRTHKRIYRYEWTDLEHRCFLRIAKALPCMVQISSYYSDLYFDALRDWRMVTFDAMTRGGVRTEYLWMNYPEPTELHDYRFAGEDYRERERIRRKVTRWTARLAKLPEIERRALITAVSADNGKNGAIAGTIGKDDAAGSQFQRWRPAPTATNGAARSRPTEVQE